MYMSLLIKNKGKKEMNVFFYIIIFIIGIMFGSFYSLTIYRSIKGQDIIGKKQCPKCEHKLGIIDMIPIINYISSKGKCRYCNEKIGIKYLILQLLTGIVFVLIAISMNFNINSITIQTIITFIFIILYLTNSILIAGLEKENKGIKKSLLIYGIMISVIYLIYLCIVEPSMKRFTIYLIITIILLVIDNVILRKKASNNYTINILMIILIMLVFTGEYISILTIILTLIEISLYMMINKLKTKNRSNIKEYANLKIGFIICTNNIIVFLAGLIYANIIQI